MTPDHLRPDLLETAQRALVAKAIGEFSHERLLRPEPDGEGWIVWAGETAYRFRATRHPLEHWRVDPASIERSVAGTERADGPTVDAQTLILDFAEVLGIAEPLLPIYLEEIASTLASSMWKLGRLQPTSGDLLEASYQRIEAAMTEGHPGFVANNGRLGFGLDDYVRYAPEAGAPVRLHWLACRRDATRLSLGAGISEDDLYEGELGEQQRAGFARVLEDLGLDPADYLLMPVHPWQWQHKVAVTFAPEVARRDLVWLGEGRDDYQAQQSIRTFFNLTDSSRHYVKTALSVQNMGFLRGLSPTYMAATPAINDFVHALVEGDEELRAHGFQVLRERAALGYTGDAYHRIGSPSAHTKMLAALWRESPGDRIGAGERLATLASLLHVDRDGTSLAATMIAASGTEPRAWVRGFLDAYLRPLVHCLLGYDLAFMPHGENLIMVLRAHRPVRMLMKDIGEEVAVMGDLPLPPEVERIRADVPADVRALAIHTDVFDGVLRHLAGLLEDAGVLAGADFWAEVGACLDRHQDDHPELAGAAATYDLRRAEFRHSCLNRLQLRNTLQMVDLADQAESLVFAGTLANPVADPVANPVANPVRSSAREAGRG